MSAGLPPTSEPSEADLVQRAQRGDPEALNLLYGRHWPAFVAFAHREWSRDWDEARDLCQEACLKSVARLPELRDPNRFRSWAMGFILNVARNWRKASQIVWYGDLADDTKPIETMTAAPPTLAQADRGFLRAELVSFSRSLKDLAGEVARWMLVVFAETGELPSVTQIAERFGLSHGNAQRVREAVLARWRETLGRYGLGP